MQNWTPNDFVGETVRVNVDVVDVFFNVKEKDKFVENLQKDDFTLLENNRKQEIRYFSAETQTPLSLGVLIDTSDSETPALQREHEVARRFFDKVLTDGDQAMVVSFDSFVDLKQEFTGDHGVLVDATGRARKDLAHQSATIDPKPVPRLRSTALYDAIAGVAEHRFAQRSGRKAMILITDGQDMGSRASAKDAIEAAVRSNTICYVLLVGDHRYMVSTEYDGSRRMKMLAEETGGRMIPIDRKMRNIEKSLLEVANELRHHYSIGYTPQDRNRKGEYRRIAIRCRKGFQVRARRGYYAIDRPAPVSGDERASN